MSYRRKYIKLKRTIKSYVFENAALCDQIAQIQDNIVAIKAERKFLLQKLMDYEDTEIQTINTSSNNNTTQPSSSGKKYFKKRLSQTNDGSKKKIIENTSTPTTSNNTITQNTTIQGLTFPLHINGLLIQTIGEIVPDNSNFHTENWIYPVGYIASRMYSHPIQPERKCIYTCRILNNNGVPQFQIIPDSDFDRIIIGKTPSECHAKLLDILLKSSNLNNIRFKPQGEAFFGLSFELVQSLISNLMNFDKCSNFKGFLKDKSFEEKNDPSLNFEALQKFSALSAYHDAVQEVKAEPPDELLE